MMNQSTNPVVVYRRSHRPWIDGEDDARLKAFHGLGYPDLQIGIAMGIPARIVSKHRRMMNLQPHIKPQERISDPEPPHGKIHELTGSKPSSVDAAKNELGDRLHIRILKGEPVYVLDGRIGATVQMIIHAANKLRLAEGKPILGRVMP